MLRCVFVHCVGFLVCVWFRVGVSCQNTTNQHEDTHKQDNPRNEQTHYAANQTIQISESFDANSNYLIDLDKVAQQSICAIMLFVVPIDVNRSNRWNSSRSNRLFVWFDLLRCTFVLCVGFLDCVWPRDGLSCLNTTNQREHKQEHPHSEQTLRATHELEIAYSEQTHNAGIAVLCGFVLVSRVKTRQTNTKSHTNKNTRAVDKHTTQQIKPHKQSNRPMRIPTI